MVLTKTVFWGILVLNLVFTYYMNEINLPKRFSRALTLVLASLAIFPIVRFRYWLVVEGGQDKVPFGSLIITIIAFAMQTILFTGAWYKKILTMILIEIFSILAELTAVFAAEWIIGPYEQFNFASMSFRFAVMMYYPAFALISIPLIYILRSVNRISEEKVSRGYEWLALAFPIAQFLMVYIQAGVTTVTTIPGLLGIFLGSVADYILIMLLNKEHTQKQLAYELEEEQRLYAQEEASYRLIEEEQEMIAQIRHDYQNQLMVLMAMQK